MFNVNVMSNMMSNVDVEEMYECHSLRQNFF